MPHADIRMLSADCTMSCCRITELQGLLQHRDQVLAVVEAEAQEVADKFGRDRSTVMSSETRQAMSVEDIIPNEQSLVVFSRKGYIKRMHASTFSVQNRGGKGIALDAQDCLC